jgi:hypothetical protein
MSGAPGTVVIYQGFAQALGRQVAVVHENIIAT